MERRVASNNKRKTHNTESFTTYENPAKNKVLNPKRHANLNDVTEQKFASFISTTPIHLQNYNIIENRTIKNCVFFFKLRRMETQNCANK